MWSLEEDAFGEAAYWSSRSGMQLCDVLRDTGDAPTRVRTGCRTGTGTRDRTTVAAFSHAFSVLDCCNYG